MTTHTCPTCHRPFRSARSTDPETSRDAGDDIEAKEGPPGTIRRGSQRHRLLTAYGSWGCPAMTDAEAAGAAAMPVRSCWWKRCSELRQAGFIAPVGTRHDYETGATARSCRITEAGRSELARLEAES